jgi:class 3 adenylate cyclase
MSDSHPSVAMFMSCDIVGSTAFKAQAEDAAGMGNWLEAFETLFRELPLIFIGELARAFMAEDGLPEAGVWKVMGDEVIFLAMPASADHAQLITAAFHRSVVQYDRRLAARWPLRIRGCCWAAEIGERNRQIEIPEMFGGHDGRPYLDFLGPDIDTGFRLSACCGSGEVIISPNLAESLAQLPEQQLLHFHRTGARALKGVCGGQPFPLVLVTTDDDPLAAARALPAVPGAELARELAQIRQRLREQGIEMAAAAFG